MVKRKVVKARRGRATPAPLDAFDWDAFEAALAGAARGRRAASAGNGAQRMDAQTEDLVRLARRSRLARARGPALGNVVFLHGITGSDLAVVDADGDSDGVWVNIPRLILGRIDQLRLDATATQDAFPGITVRPTGINQRYYAKAVLWLRAHWNVEPFAYDWRKDVDAAAAELAALVRRRFPKQPVHLVAHSMGGLVARAFIRREPELWDAMQAPELAGGGRLVMLGTPNYGSFAIPPVLAGSDSMLELLASLDLAHNMAELLDITNTFLGSYMLLPAPSKLGGALQALYQRDTWGGTPGVSQAHLDRTYQFYRELESAATIDPRRMCYVAGCRRATFTGMTIVAPGEFEYKLTYDGDGRVPHELGLLPGVPAWYVDEVHGDLARNESVLQAVDDLLQTGTTDALSPTLLRGALRAAPTMRDYRSATDMRLMDELARIADKARRDGGPEGLTREEETLAADALVRAALGAGRHSLPPPTSAVPGASPRTGPPPVHLDVAVRFSDVTRVEAPVVVVGHYRGIAPVNAIGAIDAKLGHWIARAVKQQMIAGALGETFFIPSLGRIAAGGVVVAGMGDVGQFKAADLRLLMCNVALGAGAMGFPAIASVLVGAGGGSLDRDVALVEMLEGLGVGLRQLRDEKVTAHATLTRLELIENDPERFVALVEQVAALGAAGSLANLGIRALPPRAADRRAASNARRALAQASAGGRRAAAPTGRPFAFEEVRLTVERVEPIDTPARAASKRRGDDGAPEPVGKASKVATYRFSALTRNALVPVREITLQEHYAQGAAEALRSSRTRGEQEQFGRLLYTYLVPEEFQEFIDGDAPLKLIVDRSTASFPWEMACFRGRGAQGGLRWLGTDLRLARQFRSTLARAPGMRPPVNDRLRVLVIADPAPERELQLAGARAEGRHVVDLFKGAQGLSIGGARLDIDVEQRIGAAECDPVEILALLLSGDFDVVHFAGHGDYDPDDPDATGWIFGRDKVLTARDIFRARRVPHLVFANACFSGAVREGRAFAPDELSPALATIAQAFFERGVPNYVGAGWPVDDAQALTMADRFYRELIQRQSIGRALAVGRQAVFDEQAESTWGAYQHYGDPNDTILRAQ